MSVFISYSFQDKAKFDDVSFALEQAKITPWKTDEIAAGEALREKLRSAIENCVVCVFIATPNSLASGWCQAEIGAFWGAGKAVVVYLTEETLTLNEVPQQFKGDKWATTIREVVIAVEKHLAEANDSSLVCKRPGNLFWLGHDLARAIRLAMFEPEKPSELEGNILGGLHHLDETGLRATEARTLLLEALKLAKSDSKASEGERQRLVDSIAEAKNDIGNKIIALQPGFRAYPSLETKKKLDEQAEKDRVAANAATPTAVLKH